MATAEAIKAARDVYEHIKALKLDDAVPDEAMLRNPAKVSWLPLPMVPAVGVAPRIAITRASASQPCKFAFMGRERVAEVLAKVDALWVGGGKDVREARNRTEPATSSSTSTHALARQQLSQLLLYGCPGGGKVAAYRTQMSRQQQ